MLSSTVLSARAERPPPGSPTTIRAAASTATFLTAETFVTVGLPFVRVSPPSPAPAIPVTDADRLRMVRADSRRFDPPVACQERRRGPGGRAPPRGRLAGGARGRGGAGRALDRPSPAEAGGATGAELTGRTAEQARRDVSRRWWNAVRFGYGAALRLKVRAPDLTVA